jgi:peptidoglycan/LPS O-acetylase OafA/YrhL
MVVAGVVCGKAPDNGRLSSCLIALGGASYSLYLVHPFVIAEARVWGPRGYVSDPYAAAGLLVVASLIAALLVYRWVEQPLIALIRRGFTPQMRPATAADEEPRPVPVSA